MSTDFEVTGWGQHYHPGVPEHIEYGCPDCLERSVYPEQLVINPRGWYEYVIGFSREIPGGSIRSNPHRGETAVIGCMIIECPHCHSKYFQHVTLAEVRMAVKLCPQWPK